MIGFDEIYIFFFAVGLLITIASFLLGTFGGPSGHSVDAHAGDIHVHADTGGTGSGHGAFIGDASIHGGHEVLDAGGNPFRPLSTVTICMFATAFGGAGYVAKNSFELSDWQHLAAAGGIGVVLAFLTMTFFNWALRKSQASSAPREDETLGLQASVTVAIPDRGLGRVSYVLRGSRFSALAREMNGFPIAENSKVTLVRLENGVFIVKESVGSFR
ncbi:MAG: hypothetical protein ACKVS6_16285 [Planctomycetota bacterium]